MTLSSKVEKDGHHKELRGQACTGCLVRHWTMWVWDSRTWMLKVKRVLKYFYGIRSWEMNSLSDPSAWSLVWVTSVIWDGNIILMSSGGNLFRRCSRIAPQHSQNPWAAGSGHTFKDIHPVRAPLHHITNLWGQQTLGYHLCCFYYLLLSTVCISQWQVKRYVGIFPGTKYIHFHTYKYGCGYILYMCVQTLKWKMSSAN